LEPEEGHGVEREGKKTNPVKMGHRKGVAEGLHKEDLKVGQVDEWMGATGESTLGGS